MKTLIKKLDFLKKIKAKNGKSMIIFLKEEINAIYVKIKNIVLFFMKEISRMMG